MMSVEIRPAVVGDLPAMMVLVRELAEYERLSHAVIATEASFEAALFGERPTADALVALVDVRPMLADPAEAPVVETRELREDDWVDIPSGVAHGFLALEALELVYLVTNEYDGSDELGFAWDDPTAAVPWPAIPGTSDGRPILSERDRTNPSLPELVARLRTGH